MCEIFLSLEWQAHLPNVAPFSLSDSEFTELPYYVLLCASGEVACVLAKALRHLFPCIALSVLTMLED